MNATKSHRSILPIRAATVGAVSAAVLAGGALGAVAAPTAVHTAKKPSPYPSRMLPSGPPSSAMPSSAMPNRAMPNRAMSYITIRATPTTVKSGRTVAFTGRTKGLKTGTKLTLQERLRGRWVPLRANTTVNKGGSYALKAALRAKGTQQLRVVDVATASPPIRVVVR